MVKENPFACLAGTWPTTWKELIMLERRRRKPQGKELECLPDADLTHSKQIVQILTLAA
jgi:hypothetical protein